MSKCISAQGEYSEHELGSGDMEFVCTLCFVLDEDAVKAEVDRLRAENENLRQGAKSLMAEIDRLRAQVAAVESVLEEGDHGLYCDSHYGNHCTCWNHKIAIITGYGYE